MKGLCCVQAWKGEDVCAPKLAKMINKAGAHVYPTVDAIQVLTTHHSVHFAHESVFHTILLYNLLHAHTNTFYSCICS
jgi:hypothetical protein